MAIYYCLPCANALGLKDNIDTSRLLDTSYQQRKFTKHTAPATSHRVQTVFDSNNTQYYADCIDETIEKGFVEIDDQSRKNILFCPSTGSSIGSKYKWGQLTAQVDTVVVVKTSDGAALHSFLENSSSYSNKRCAACRKAIL